MAQLNPKEMQQALALPFAPEDLEWRLQNTIEEQMRGLAVPYVTNRAIQNRLDEVCGPENWYNDFKPWHSNGKKEAQLCGIAIYFEGRGFITKWDGAEDSDIEAVKGGLSDSMKRAAVQWGIGRVLYDLKNTPYSRRIMTNTYVFSDLSEMHLYPCAYSVTYNVTQRPQDDKPTLNMILNQRSQDILAANNWNVCQYAILLMMVAQSVDMIPGELLHVIADAHIYDRHVDIVRELIERPQFAAPKVTLNPDVHDFYAFTTDDLIVEGYEHGPQVKNIPIAV